MATFTITGATGSVGKAIVAQLLSEKHHVRVLSTRQNLEWKGVKTYYWNPAQGEIDLASLEGTDHLIHLAGTTVSKRWTAKYKQSINDSRVYTSQTLIDALQKLEKAPSSCVSASAIGFYGSDFERTMVEGDLPADDFLAAVTRNWEQYTRKLGNDKRRSIQLRIGIVLDKGAGVLGELVPLAKAGIASPLGSGKQWSSWIHIKDLARMFIHAATSTNIASGPYNAVGPNPATNKDLTKTICKVLSRPMLLPSVPGFVLKLFLGEMATLALMSQKVSNKKILKTGFAFEFENLEGALRNVLK